jgi:hypothetical protein
MMLHVQKIWQDPWLEIRVNTGRWEHFFPMKLFTVPYDIIIIFPSNSIHRNSQTHTVIIFFITYATSFLGLFHWSGPPIWFCRATSITGRNIGFFFLSSFGRLVLVNSRFWSCSPLLISVPYSMFGLVSYPEDRGNKFLQNVHNVLPD